MDGASLGTAAIIAVFLVPLVSLIKRPSWSTELRHMLALGAALVAALVGAFVDGNVHSIQELVPLLGTAFVTSQTLYTLYFSKTEVNAKLEKVGA